MTKPLDGFAETDAVVHAYERAAVRAAAADAVAAEMRMRAVKNLRNEGHSVRQIASLMSVPKSTVARDLLNWPSDGPPECAPAQYVAAHNAVWPDHPAEQFANAPFTRTWDESTNGFRYEQLMPAGYDEHGRLTFSDR